MNQGDLVKKLIEYAEGRLKLSDMISVDAERCEFRHPLQRMVALPAKALASVLRELESVIGPAYISVIIEGAKRYTREVELKQIGDYVSPENRMKVVSAMFRLYRELGWGKVFDVEFDEGRGVLRFRVENSVEADGWGSSEHPVCHIILGYNIALMEWALGKPMIGEEVRCKAKGDPYCEFVIRAAESGEDGGFS